jgi:hypothetical protein
MQKRRLAAIPQMGHKRDEAAEVVAEIFGTTSQYIRQIMSGRKMKTPNGKERAKLIRNTYLNYKRGKDTLKNNLVKAVEKLLAA